jgi:DNA-directed RNA polymerase specialized sigma24 family protein
LHGGTFQVLERMVEAMTKGSRAEKAAALKRWADHVQPDALVEIDTTVLRHLGELAQQRATLDGELREAVLAARRSDRSWSEIGAMLGVSKQAAQRKYGRATSAA